VQTSGKYFMADNDPRGVSNEAKAPQLYAPHDDLPALMGTAHAKPSGRRYMPSLTRHVSLWMPAALEKAIPQSDEGRDKWVRDVETFILAIYDKLKAEHPDKILYPDVPPLSVTNFLEKSEEHKHLLGLLRHFYDTDETRRRRQAPRKIPGTFRQETVRINGVWQSMPVEITVELHAEYVTISTAIDLGHRKAKALYAESSPAYRAAKDALALFDRVTTQRAGLIKKEKGKSYRTMADDSARLQPAFSRLYYTTSDKKTPSVWKAMRDDLFGPAVAAVGRDNLGRMFGDLRGLLLRGAGDKDKHFVALAHPEEEKGLPHQPSLKEIIAGQPFGGKDANDERRMQAILQAVDALRPFLLADPRLTAAGDGEVSDQRPEVAFSTLFGGHGLQMSMVSQQNPDPRVSIAPLPYLALMTRGSTREVARLADTGNRLNTLRLAALYGFREMAGANRELHALEQKLNGLLQELPDILEKKDGGAEVSRRLIGFDKEIAQIAAKVPGGLHYRGERSAYYRAQFEEAIAPVDIGRIPGFQSFAEMVERRLGPLYEIIHQTHLRRSRILDLMKEIGERAQTDREVKAQERIKEMQQDVEPIFFIAITAYYAGEVVVRLAGKESLDKIWGHAIEKQFDIKSGAEAGATFLAGLAGLIWWKRKNLFRGLEDTFDKAKHGLHNTWRLTKDFSVYSKDLVKRKSHGAAIACRHGQQEVRRRKKTVWEWQKQRTSATARKVANVGRRTYGVIRSGLPHRGNGSS
jgi:hypothetical protein